ncbi:hypothetical protein C7974DRAFT_179237 [Boeremia exigua]|uniref:uncharacterized protein n=1 Tax=Boeremia exigua TaxID=749465 RepID=UPI001E8D2966|nr:uncharacterized protein C7974DRAFT_179237 [Boeremia exigua]KAH6629031.1 hypothetical protein C7974DRAFT_179237 [Boeremia exigua]
MPVFAPRAADVQYAPVSAQETLGETGAHAASGADSVSAESSDHGAHSEEPASGVRNAGSRAAYKGPEIVGWPGAPAKLSGFSVPLFVGDVLLVLLPIAFLVLGIAAWRLDGKGLSEMGATVERAMQLGPTIYPLAFAAIGSRCLRNVAVRLAERGTTIATLEKLLGSQSLVSAVGTAFTLRSVSLLSLSLLSLWALSPLGGQSSLRLIHQVNSTISEPGTVFFSGHDAPFDPDETGPTLPIVPAILSASLASSQETKALPVDLWNHPKIPRLDAIERLAMTGMTDTGEWIEVDAAAEQQYSSWAGVNVQNLQRTGNVDFQVPYNYIHLECEVLFSGAAYTVWEDMLDAKLAMSPAIATKLPGNNRSSPETEAYAALATRDNLPALPMFLKVAYPSNTTHRDRAKTPDAGFVPENQPISLLYGAKYANSTGSNEVTQVYTCAPHVVTLDARITCQAGNCAATQLRYVPGPSRRELETTCRTRYTIGCLAFATAATRPFIRWLPQMLDSPITSKRSPFDDWIGGANVTYPGYTDDLKSGPRVADAIPAARIARRLTAVLNTFFQAVVWGPQITRAGLFDAPQPVDDNAYSYLYQAAPERYINATDAVFSRAVLVYDANGGWIATLLVITAVLLLLSIANIVISFLTIAPDLFYYASSLARENPYTDTPTGGTAMNGGERSRLLKAMRVQIADVSPESQVGYVVLKSVGEGDDFATGRLRKDRLYW